jgi:hypothetical protein
MHPELLTRPLNRLDELRRKLSSYQESRVACSSRPTSLLWAKSSQQNLRSSSCRISSKLTKSNFILPVVMTVGLICQADDGQTYAGQRKREIKALSET